MSALRCSTCGKPHKRKQQRYCAGCHARYMRGWRKKVKAEQQAVARFLRRYVSRETEARAA